MNPLAAVAAAAARVRGVGPVDQLLLGDRRRPQLHRVPGADLALRLRPDRQDPGRAQGPHRPGPGGRRAGSQGPRRRRGRARRASSREARREASALIAAAQKAAQDLRDADIAATTRGAGAAARARPRPTSPPSATAPWPICGPQVADLALAAAGKVVGETMTDARQRRLVEEFLREPSGARATGQGPTDARAWAPAGATRRRPSSWPSATARSTRGSATWHSPRGWPRTSGSPGPWTARPCRLAVAARGASSSSWAAACRRQALNLALLLAQRGRFSILPESAPSTMPWSAGRAASSAATVTTPGAALRRRSWRPSGHAWSSSPGAGGAGRRPPIRRSSAG